MDLKLLKQKLGVLASESPEKFYPVQVLKDEGFKRGNCRNCGKFFWSVDDRRVCGEPACIGGYEFIRNPPRNVKRLDFIGVWSDFSQFLKKRSYTPVSRYPIVARWRSDVFWNNASIYNFQPLVVKGEVDPPANPLLVPQICARFNDVGNVGVTGRHQTSFVMIGQHSFQSKELFDQEKYFQDLFDWFVKGLRLRKQDLIIHEDQWGGGGNLGPSLEFFSRGLELANQVYMLYETTSNGWRELSLKVLDMGMGQSRPAWLVSGENTAYDVNYGLAVKKLYKKLSVKKSDLFDKFLPYSGLLNLDEVRNVNQAWKSISEKVGVSVEELKSEVLPLIGLYSLADHTSTLLFAISDGVIPSNSGGAYNLRVIFRRAYDFIKMFDWDVELAKIAEWHAKFFKKQYPELSNNLDEVSDILSVEARKYEKTLRENEKLLSRLGKGLSVEKIVELYDSNGITPQVLVSKGLISEVPSNFYELLEEKKRDESKKLRVSELKVDVKGFPSTEILYYSDYSLTSFTAKVLGVVENKFVVLDRTAFYPTSGGQKHDKGLLNGVKVVNVFKVGGVVLHQVESANNFKRGSVVKGVIDWERRKQLAQHHTAVHLVNGACRAILGNHCWQSGAEKTVEKARLDITHYDNLSREELIKVEDLCNDLIKKKVPVISKLMKKNEAEKEYGFVIYQGGVAPGSVLRIVDISGFDVEACGGTHLKNLSELEVVKVVSSKKLSDGVVRLELLAGDSVKVYMKQVEGLTNELCSLLGTDLDGLVNKGVELFEAWKNARKGREAVFNRGESELVVINDHKKLRRVEAVLDELSSVWRTPRNHLIRTAEKFLKRLK